MPGARQLVNDGPITVNGRIEREWVALEINELLVVEYYSRNV